MNLYLAGSTPITGSDLYTNVKSRLFSYVEKPNIKKIDAESASTYKNLMIDSGAFSVWSRGKVIRVEDYADFIIHSRNSFKRIKNVFYVNLDVIGDELQTKKNLEYLENKRGLEVLPVFTYKASFKELERLIESYKYVLFGGLVPLTNKQLIKWLDPCFNIIMKYYRKTGKLLKVHLLGITRIEFVNRYPIFSCDSTTWFNVIRFGIVTKAIGVRKKMPRVAESESAKTANVYVIKKEIDRFMRREQEVTNLWKYRGIEFNE
mgnify:CR=1 FL=1|jgi:hypothetical protein|tara:strand:+ start:883 stop:1668 length:786 start_codon:yes stop_codon:yes gene_type:complete